MAELPAFMQPHTAGVQTFLGATGVGTSYTEAVEVRCRIDEQLRLVRNSDGNQVLSTATLYTSDSTPGRWLIGSLVIWGGQACEVLAVAVRDDGGMGGWQHTEVNVG